MEDKLKKSVLVAALLFSAFSCVTVMAAENIPANSQIFKEAKSLPFFPFPLYFFPLAFSF